MLLQEEFWTQSKWLINGSLVCLLRPGDPTLFAEIILRDAENLVQQQQKPGAGRPALARIGLRFCNPTDLQSLVNSLGMPLWLRAPYTLVQACSNFFSVKPVLECLQSTVIVPFAEELFNLRAPTTVHVMEPAAIAAAAAEQNMDAAQTDAFTCALTQRVALVQGPPGTGKTRIGLALARALIAHGKAPLLCVCYTNHALHQFLENIIAAGVPQAHVVRVGGRSKSTTLQACQLVQPGERRARSVLPLSGKAHACEIREEVDSLDNRVRACAETLQSCGSVRVPWQTMRTWLEKNDRSVLAAFPPMLKRTAQQGAGKQGADASSLAERWQLAWSKAKDGLWRRWLAGLDSLGCSEHELWGLSRSARRERADAWAAEMQRECRQQVLADLERCAALRDESKALRSHADSQRLRNAQVIGFTATGAAKNRCA